MPPYASHIRLALRFLRRFFRFSPAAGGGNGLAHATRIPKKTASPDAGGFFLVVQTPQDDRHEPRTLRQHGTGGPDFAHRRRAHRKRGAAAVSRGAHPLLSDPRYARGAAG